MNGAPANSWRNPFPSATEYCASGATKKINRLLGRVGSRTPIRNINSAKALSAKASGLFALGVDLMNLKAVIQKIAQRFIGDMKVDIKLVSEVIKTESHMADTQAVPGNTNAATYINTAIQIALALKSIDPSLTVETVQAGTAAALGAIYPVA